MIITSWPGVCIGASHFDGRLGFSGTTTVYIHECVKMQNDVWAERVFSCALCGMVIPVYEVVYSVVENKVLKSKPSAFAAFFCNVTWDLRHSTFNVCWF